MIDRMNFFWLVAFSISLIKFPALEWAAKFLEIIRKKATKFDRIWQFMTLFDIHATQCNPRGKSLLRKSRTHVSRNLIASLHIFFTYPFKEWFAPRCDQPPNFVADVKKCRGPLLREP